MAIGLAKDKGMNTSAWERHLANLLEMVVQEPSNNDGFVPWMLWEWRRVSVPEWRKTLKDSIVAGNRARADYARWMLREVLFDPEYEDGA